MVYNINIIRLFRRKLNGTKDMSYMWTRGQKGKV
jgi:hypothetical protein